MESWPDRSRTLRGTTLLIAAALAVAGCGGGDGTATDGAASSSPAPPATSSQNEDAVAPAPLARTLARVRRELRDIPQRGLVLGRETAPVTIIEYGQFACPSCAAAHRTVVPAVIERYVRTGVASLEFRGIGTSDATPSQNLALGAIAASAQQRGWEFVQLAYLRGLEGAGAREGTPAESPIRLATALGLDGQAWRDDLTRPASLAQVAAAANVAAVARFTAYPVFLVRARNRPSQPFVVLSRPRSVREFAAAIAKARDPRG